MEEHPAYRLADRSAGSAPNRGWLSVRLGVAAGLSLLLHLLTLLVVVEFRRQADEVQAFRTRLELPVRFQPRRLGAARPRSLPAREMEYRRAGATPRALPDPGLDLPRPPRPDLPGAVTPLSPLELGGRTDSFAHPEEGTMPAPGDYGWTDTLSWEHLELLRVEDLARVEVDHAAVILDPTDQRGITGFVTLTPLRIYGAGSGYESLDALARYMRDNTSLLVQVRPRRYDYFVSENLLRDPIHFLVQGGGFEPHTDAEITRLSERERQLLGRYLRQGGFLFIEGGYRFLGEWVAHLRRILGEDGQIYPLPASHPLYSAFFTFGAGFPGEDKPPGPVGLPPSWYYPADRRVDQPASPAPANRNQPEESPAEPSYLGLWGVEVQGEVVAVLSDLGLHAQWGRHFDDDQLEAGPVLLQLRAGANIIVYALTRPGSSTPNRQLPAWVESRPSQPVAEPHLASPASSPAQPGADDLVLGQLSGSLAVVRSPLGTELGRGGVRVRVDGRHRVTILRPTHHGVLLRNLPAGSRWLEIEYGGQRLEVAVELTGGRVTTVSLGVSRLAFFTRLRARSLGDRLEVAEWFRRFDDLSIDEVFLEQDELAPPAAP